MSKQDTGVPKEVKFGSAEWYRSVVDSANIGIYEVDLLSNEINYSHQFAACFGLSGNHLKFENFLSLLLPEDTAIRDEAHRISKETGHLAYEARFRWKDGSVHWLRFSGTVTYNKEKIPVRLFGTAIDITEQRMAISVQSKKLEEGSRFINKLDQELHRSEERYLRMIAEVKDYAFILLDLDGTIINWNQGAANIKGYSESEILGKNFRIFYLPGDQEQGLPEKLINLARTEGRAAHEGYRVRKDGTRFWGSVVITALHNQAGEVISFSKVTRDLTDKKNAEDKLKRYTEELEVRNKELEQFAYVASHDLQEPLRKIQVFTGLLKKNLDDKEQAEKYFEKIVGSAQRMSDLIESILKYSRLSPSEKEFTSVDLNLVLHSVKSDLELVIDETEAIIVSDELPVLVAVESQMHQLFYNIISNSLKFTEKKPMITIRSSIIAGSGTNDYFQFDPEMKYVEIIFSDNGIGFDSEEAAKIFTVFMRLHGQRYAGSGIGLALCKKIVENHHGFIRAESAPGNGASFYVYLPIRLSPESER
ncbi:PAS domain S-box protein [Pollutibacter soli]|uniref:sensor histidine kinase n=1 Tax=Pollutibacter soli TaxID=3034157 RepID=UPI00301366E1